MALIRCPECQNSISDKAAKCPHCGLPAEHFGVPSANPKKNNDIDYKSIANIIISFDKDYIDLFSDSHYISHREQDYMHSTYGEYYVSLKNKLIFQYVCNNASSLRIDIDGLKRFLRKMHTLDENIVAHNEEYIEKTLVGEKDYFDNILAEIDPKICLDDEQRRAVVTDDDYCLLVAGAGAGKTTTMAAKVKYLVEKKHVNPEEIMVISYTKKAIGELSDRINKGLKIPAKICTFHKFAFDIVKRFSVEPPEINFSSYQIVFDMLEK